MLTLFCLPEPVSVQEGRGIAHKHIPNVKAMLTARTLIDFCLELVRPLLLCGRCKATCGAKRHAGEPPQESKTARL